MQKGKHAQYVAAGVQAVPGMRLHVRSNVRLPNSEAGGFYAQERQPYYASQVRARSRMAATVPLNAALLILCALFVAFGALIVSRASRRAEISKQITAMQNGIIQTEKENRALLIELEEARASTRISYAATHSLHMVDASSVAPIQVVAPNTRPYDTVVPSQLAASPSAVGDNVIGSR